MMMAWTASLISHTQDTEDFTHLLPWSIWHWSSSSASSNSLAFKTQLWWNENYEIKTIVHTHTHRKHLIRFGRELDTFTKINQDWVSMERQQPNASTRLDRVLDRSNCNASNVVHHHHHHRNRAINYLLLHLIITLFDWFRCHCRRLYATFETNSESKFAIIVGRCIGRHLVYRLRSLAAAADDNNIKIDKIIRPFGPYSSRCRRLLSSLTIAAFLCSLSLLSTTTTVTASIVGSTHYSGLFPAPIFLSTPSFWYIRLLII